MCGPPAYLRRQLALEDLVLLDGGQALRLFRPRDDGRLACQLQLCAGRVQLRSARNNGFSDVQHSRSLIGPSCMQCLCTINRYPDVFFAHAKLHSVQ